MTTAIAATLLGAAPTPPFERDHTALERARLGRAENFRPEIDDSPDPVVAADAETRRRAAVKPVWPATTSTRVTLPTTAGKKARAAALPIELGSSAVKPALRGSAARTAAEAAPEAAQVKVLDRETTAALGIDGVVLTVARADGDNGDASMDVTVDYTGFADAYTGNWSSRLRMVQLPACAISTPEKPACRATTPLPSGNDTKDKSVTAQVTVPETTSAASGFTVLALSAGATSEQGSYDATPLSPSATWAGGGSNGDFTWSYPIDVVPLAAGPAPSPSLSYSAQSVDGRTSSTSAQPSWIGEGWDLSTSYIERSYGSCDDDGQEGKYDKCWREDNASIVLNGKASTLVKDSAGKWHMQSDDGERIVRGTGAPNGDDGDAAQGGEEGDKGEYWTVTAVDGTQYVFGKHQLEGWTSGKAVTNSVWTVPVFGDDSGEPGFSAGTTFASRAKNQAWRWNLDYVVDPHDNVMTYWYDKELNYYAKAGSTGNGTEYTRGGTLRRIDYGQRTDTIFSTAQPAAARVKFQVDERCRPVTGGETCQNLTSANRTAWPDVPFDQICAKNTVCTDQPTPSFFSRMRLTGITTQVYKGAGTGVDTDYRGVNTWQLVQSFPNPGDGSNAGLWLNSIQRTGTGNGATAVSLPVIDFKGIQLHNRVDSTEDDVPAYIKWRLRSIKSETGSMLTVTYSDPECLAGTNVPGALDSNNKRCFPVKWIPPSNPTPGTNPAPRTDWFHKYVVTQVTETDPTGGGPTKVTSYEYDPNGGAWAYDDQSPVTPAKYRTWGTWRGYEKVTTLTGEGAGIRSKTVSLYYRGMHGDKQEDGTTRSESITDSTPTTVTDHEQYAGQLREQITYNGTTGAAINGTINTPWSHNTATQTHSYGTVRAHIVRAGTQTKRTPVPNDTPITSSTTNNYDTSTGLVLTAETTGGGETTCARTEYASNETALIRNAPKRVEQVQVDCSATPKRVSDPATTDVISDSRLSYDGQAWGAAPTKGDVTTTKRVTGYDANGNAQLQTVSTAAHDSMGRVTDEWDTTGTRTKHLEFTPAKGGPVTSTKAVNALGHTVTTDLYTDWGVNKASTDPNGRRTEMAYDALGRLTDVWFADRARATQTPSKKFEYKIEQTKASWVATKSLNNDGTTYQTSYAIYDALLRARQTQAPAVGTGRVISETKYDSRGLTVETSADYVDTTAPTGALATLITPAPAGTATTYDGAGRATVVVNLTNGTEHSRTTTTYEGNSTTVEPPVGASAVRDTVDSRGRLAEKREYEGNKATGSSTTLTYTYGRNDQLTKVEDSAHNSWTYGYDFLGRKKTSSDPDTGKTTTEYNSLDQVSVTEEANHNVLSYTYDVLGRTTGKLAGRIPLVDGTPTIDDSKYLARWSYDTIAKGRPTSSIRYEGGKNGKVYAKTNASYDPLYRVLKEQYTISTSEGAVAGSGVYTLTNAYNLDGTLQQRVIPAMGGLAQEVLVYGYNQQRMPTTLAGLTGIVQSTAYLPAGEHIRTTLGVSTQGKWTEINRFYEDGTKRLRQQTVVSESHSGTDADFSYRYDPAGNPTEIRDTSTTTPDRQCFTYDGHRRLKSAWTSITDCTAAPTGTTVGGPAAYWKSFTYDTAGNRKQATDHLASGGSATTTYTYDTRTSGGVIRPHLLTGTDTAPADATNPALSYTYDESGNTTTRTEGTKSQTLSWGPENTLTKVTEGSTETTFLNDAEGNRLIRRDAGGTTLHLGETELRFDKSTGAVQATRYYSHAGQMVAIRTPQSLTWHATDHNGTGNLQIDAASQAVTRRYTQPFGEDRGAAPANWTGEKGFVGGTKDPTGLIQIGARSYDADSGRFVSADPVMDLKDPQQVNGYAYSNNNPVTFADPDGRFLIPFIGIIVAAVLIVQAVLSSPGTTTGSSGTNRNSGGSSPGGSGNYGSSGRLCGSLPNIYATNASSCGSSEPSNPRELGDFSDFLGGIGHNVVSGVEFMAELSPGCWFEDCSGATAMYDEFATSIGLQKGSESWDGGDMAMTIAGIGSIAGSLRSLIKWGIRGLSRNAGTLDDAAGGTSGGAREIDNYRADGETSLHGHGGWKEGYGYITVPEGTTLNFYGPDLYTISRQQGLRITGPGGPRMTPDEVVGPGQRVKNYRLSPLGEGFTFRKGATVVEEPTLLSNLLKDNMGTCHWAACRGPKIPRN
ncbi:putative adhesin [Streptomyces sp. NPDC042898]|uniref:putative adhesin n=1 Tax=Streptomyces sp. NPDC042898 TaxID=3154334 RepID=UPI0033F6ABB5